MGREVRERLEGGGRVQESYRELLSLFLQPQLYSPSVLFFMLHDDICLFLHLILPLDLEAH